MRLNKTAVAARFALGMTLIEITVVILVLLTLIAVLFIGANIYKTGTERAACILNIRNIHQAVRAHQNLQGANIGDPLDTSLIYGPGLYLDSEPSCPTNTGGYNETATFPVVGMAAATCDDYGAAVVEDHVPANTDGW